MLVSLLWMIGAGFVGGQVARRLGAPPLIGMILVGILLGPELGNRLAPELFAVADPLRTIAVMVILMRAGLGLDREKLQQQGSVAIRLGCLPALCEAIAVMAASIWLFQFDWLTGLLLGCIVGAESPAVIVPGMLRLKRLGWGVAKGIPDVILTSSALSDVLILLLFSLLVNRLTQGGDLSALALLPFQVLLQIALGVALGYIAAQLMVWLLVRQRWTQNAVQDVIVVTTVALGLVAIAHHWPYFSGYLAVMALGFFVVERDAPLARQLRLAFNNLWVVAEIILFVLMGASVQISVLENSLVRGLGLLAFGLLVGRMLGWWLSTLGSNWTWKERLFLLPGNSAKATVQAAIGAIPLSLGIEGGEVILAIAALSILITAPLGAWAIQLCAPKLLQKDSVDATKIAVQARTVLLAIVDASPLAETILGQAANLARRCNGEVVILYIQPPASHIREPASSASPPHATLPAQEAPHLANAGEGTPPLIALAQTLLLDIRHRVIATDGPIAAAIQRTAAEHSATEIVIGRRNYESWNLSSTPSRPMADTSHIPIVIIDA